MNRAIEYTLKLLGAEEVDKKLSGVAATAARAEGAFGSLGSSTQRLAGAASILSPALGSLVRDVSDLADVGEIAAQSAGRLGVSLGAVGAALGIAATAAGVAYLAYQELSEGHVFAEETVKALTTAQEANAKASLVLENTLIDLKVAVGEYSAETGRAIQRVHEFKRANEDAYTRLAQIRKQMGGVGAQAGEFVEGLRSIPIIGEYNPAILAYDALTTSISELRAEEEALQSELSTGLLTLKETRVAEEALADARANNAAATQRSTEMARSRADAERDAARALRDAARAEEERLAAQSRAWASEFKAGQQMAAISSGQAGMAAAAASVDMAVIGTQIDAAIRQYQRQTLAGGALSGVGAVSSALAGGDVTSLLSLAGPQGAAAGAALSGLSALGSQSPAQTAAQVEAFSKAIIKGIEVLPEVLVEVLPQLAQTLAVELPIALIQTIPRLVQEVLSAWRGGGSTSIGALSERQRASLGGVSTGISSALSATAVASSSLPRDSAARAAVSLQRALSRGGISRGPVIRLSSPSIFETIDAINLGSGPGGLREAY